MSLKASELIISTSEGEVRGLSRKQDQKIQRNMVLCLAGQFVSILGSHMYAFAIGLYILSVTGSGMNFALTLVLSTLPRIIFGPISGVISDRFDKKKLVVGLDILSGLIVLGLLVIASFDSLRISYIYVTTVLLVTCSTFFQSAFQAAVPRIVNPERLTRINSLSQAIGSGSGICGPFVGGLVFALIDIRIFLLINGLSFIISGISELFIDFNVMQAPKNKAQIKLKDIHFIKEMKEGFQYILDVPWLKAIVTFAVLFNAFTVLGLIIPIPVYIKTELGFTSQQYGFYSASYPVGMLLASLLISMLPESKKVARKLIIGIAAFSICILASGIVLALYNPGWSNWLVLGLLSLFAGLAAVASAFINIPIGVTFQKMVPEDLLGRVGATTGTLTQALFPLGAALAGVLTDLIPAWVLTVGSGVAMILLCGMLMLDKSVQEI